MATYVYELPDGEFVERQYPMGKAPGVVKVRGQRAKRCSYHGKTEEARPGRGWPMISRSMAVHRRQVPELQAFLKAHNCGAKVLPDGTVQIASMNQQREFSKLRGVRNLDSYD